jgi:integrase
VNTARKTDPIRKITTKNGEVRYRFIIDVGKRPDGKRDQRCFTNPSLREARAERAKIISDRSRGTLVKRTKITLAQAIDDWLTGRRNLRRSTQRNYADSLELAKVRLGHIQLQDLTKAHLDRLVTELQTSGRRIGNVQRQGLSPRSVNLTLTLLSSVLDNAMRDGMVVRNVAKLVERPSQTKREMSTWTADQAAGFLEAVATDRLSAAWHHRSTVSAVVRCSDFAGPMSILMPGRSRSGSPGPWLPVRLWKVSRRPNGAVVRCRSMTLWLPLCAP